MSDRSAERYWDERARENALYFVDNRLDYGAPDEDAFWTGGDETLDAILDLVGQELGPEEHVIDVGCGVGRMTRALAGRVGRVTGLDISSEMLAQAREANAALTNVDWVHGDGSTLQPIPDASADGCFSHVVFQHVPDPAITLGYVREMGRVLRPGGWAVFQVSMNPAVHAARPPLRSRVKAALGSGPKGQADAAWLGSAVEGDALRAAAADGGLEVEALVNPDTQFAFVRARKRA